MDYDTTRYGLLSPQHVVWISKLSVYVKYRYHELDGISGQPAVEWKTHSFDHHYEWQLCEPPWPKNLERSHADWFESWRDSLLPDFPSPGFLSIGIRHQSLKQIKVAFSSPQEVVVTDRWFSPPPTMIDVSEYLIQDYVRNHDEEDHLRAVYTPGSRMDSTRIAHFLGP